MKTEEWNCKAQWKAFCERMKWLTCISLICLWQWENAFEMKSICPILFKTLMHLSMPDFCLLWHAMQCNYGSPAQMGFPLLKTCYCHIWLKTTWCKINHLKFGWSGSEKGAKCNSSLSTHISFLLAFCILIFPLEMWGPPPNVNLEEIQHFKASRQIYLFGTICLCL